ncbi:MAG: DegT/DnrJ/EryC1/StrS family aminotransferase [Planctomycetota bacterium]
MTDAAQIPLLDLGPQHRALARDMRRAVTKVLTTQWFVLGPEGKALEAESAQAIGVKHAIGCASGSDALLLVLRALDYGPGDSIVTTPMTFFASAGAPARLGCRVDFVDIEPDTINMDPAALERFLATCTKEADGTLREPKQGARVRAVMAVDIFGRPCDYERLQAICTAHGLELIEDAAQAWGSSYRGKRCGAFGRAATFSFYPTKNLGGAGDGGLITTDDDALAERLRSLRVHGSSKRRYVHEEVGINSRLDELQAAIVRVKLPHVDGWNAQRRVHAAAYDSAFEELEGVTPLRRPLPHVETIYHLYTVRAERRDELKAALDAAKVGNGVYYPIPLHLQECFANFGYRAGDLPQAEAAAAEVISLPMYPELPEDARARVIDAVRRFYA